jgi:hypothetical protein
MYPYRYAYSYDAKKHRYLIKHQGVWKILETWAMKPDWDDDVTDVIWLKSGNMITSWWQLKDGKRYQPYIVRDEELMLILLQVQS